MKTIKNLLNCIFILLFVIIASFLITSDINKEQAKSKIIEIPFIKCYKYGYN